MTYAWSLVSGPNSPVINNPTSAQPQVSNLVAGSYIFGLTVFNSYGLENQSTVSVTMQPANTTVVNTGTTISTAPIGGGGMGPYGGASGGGGGGASGASNDQPATAPVATPWDNLKHYVAHNWWWMLLLAAGAVYVGSLEGGEKS